MTPRPRRAAIPALALLAATAVWGSTFVVAADVIANMSVSAFLTWRFALATTVLLVIRPRVLTSLTRADLTHGLLLGGALGAGYILQTYGLKTTPATVSGFITGMFLVFTPLVARVTLHRPIPATAWWAVGIATLGLAVISLQGLSIGIGELLTLGGALAFACQIVGLSNWSTTATAYGLAVVQLATVTVICAAMIPFETGPRVPPSPRVWAEVLFLALIATAVVFIVQSWAQAQLEPTRAAIILTGEPVFAGITGFLAGEPITARLLIGGGLVLTAMYIVELGPRHSSEARIAHLEP